MNRSRYKSIAERRSCGNLTMKNWTFCVFMQHLVLRVPLCCEKCIQKVTDALYEVEGVRNVACDQAEQKVIVSGNVDPERALRRVRRVKKKSLYWNVETRAIRSF
jgi:copper chaperone CopZ